MSLTAPGEQILARITTANRRLLADLDHVLRNVQDSLARV